MHDTRKDDTLQDRLAKRLSDRADRRGLMHALDVSQSLVWFDTAGTITEANANSQQLLAFRAVDMVGRSYFDLIGEGGTADPLILSRWDRICEGVLPNEERHFYTSAGREVWCSASYAAIRTEPKGRTRRVLAILIDLSPWSWKPGGDALAGW